jgi:hypothetical protein
MVTTDRQFHFVRTDNLFVIVLQGIPSLVLFVTGDSRQRA